METNTAPQDPTAQDQPVSDQPTAETVDYPERFPEWIDDVIGKLRTHAAMVVNRPVNEASLRLLPSGQQCATLAAELEHAKTGATTLIAQLRADLAAAREELEDWKAGRLQKMTKGRLQAIEDLIALRKENEELKARAVEAERVLIKFTNAYDRDCADDYERTLNNLEAAFELACTLLSERSTACVAGLPGDGEGN